MIKGVVQAIETNQWGYARLKIAGAWYGADQKGEITSVKAGDLVEIDAYEKSGKNGGKLFNNFKSQSLKKLKGPAPGAKVDSGPTASKDEYWAKKEANDAAKEPRIAYFAASERAIQFSALAIANGGFDALGKAKPAKKLEILEAFVDEQTLRIMAASYGAAVPAGDAPAAGNSEDEAGEQDGEGSEDDEDADEGKWS